MKLNMIHLIDWIVVMSYGISRDKFLIYEHSTGIVENYDKFIFFYSFFFYMGRKKLFYILHYC